MRSRLRDLLMKIFIKIYFNLMLLYALIWVLLFMGVWAQIRRKKSTLTCILTFFLFLCIYCWICLVMFLSYWNYHGCPKIFLPKGDEFFLNLLKCQFTMIDQNTKPLLHLDAFRNFLRLKQLISLVKLVSFVTKDFWQFDLVVFSQNPTVHNEFLAMKVYLWAFCSTSGIEPMTLVQCGLPVSTLTMCCA